MNDLSIYIFMKEIQLFAESKSGKRIISKSVDRAEKSCKELRKSRIISAEVWYKPFDI